MKLSIAPITTYVIGFTFEVGELTVTNFGKYDSILISITLTASF